MAAAISSALMIVLTLARDMIQVVVDWKISSTNYRFNVDFMYLKADRNIALAFLSGVHPDDSISSYTAGTWNIILVNLIWNSSWSSMDEHWS